MAENTPAVNNENDPDEIKVTLKRKTKNVTIEDENGEIKHFTLREMTGGARDNYIAAEGKRQKFVDGKSVGVGDYTNIQAELIARCLFDASGNPVPVKDIATWPASQQMLLNKVCIDLNGLGGDPKEAGKNA